MRLLLPLFGFCISFFFCEISHAQFTGPITFQKLYESDSSFQALNILPLSDKGYLFMGVADTTGGGRQIFATKIDCTGAVQWSRKFGASSTSGNTHPSAVETENGDIIYTNNVGNLFSYDIVVVKMTNNGDVIWKKRYGRNGDDQSSDIVQTLDGNFVICGHTNSWGTDAGRSQTDMYLFKIDGDGNVLWNHTFGNPNAYDNLYAIQEDARGNLVMAGRSFIDPLQFLRPFSKLTVSATSFL